MQLHPPLPDTLGKYAFIVHPIDFCANLKQIPFFIASVLLHAYNTGVKHK